MLQSVCTDERNSSATHLFSVGHSTQLTVLCIYSYTEAIICIILQLNHGSTAITSLFVEDSESLCLYMETEVWFLIVYLI